MSHWSGLPKIVGIITRIQIEQHGQESALVFALRRQPTEQAMDVENGVQHFANPFHGDPVVSAQFDLLRDAFNNNRMVRITHEKIESNKTPRMFAVRIQSD